MASRSASSLCKTSTPKDFSKHWTLTWPFFSKTLAFPFLVDENHPYSWFDHLMLNFFFQVISTFFCTIIFTAMPNRRTCVIWLSTVRIRLPNSISEWLLKNSNQKIFNKTFILLRFNYVFVNFSRFPIKKSLMIINIFVIIVWIYLHYSGSPPNVLESMGLMKKIKIWRKSSLSKKLRFMKKIYIIYYIYITHTYIYIYTHIYI